MNRRHFLATAATATVAGLYKPLDFAFGIPAGRFTELRRGVGVYQNSGGTMGWLVRPGAAAVVDSQFREQASEFASAFGGRATEGIDILLNTHHHRDHTSGNIVLAPLAEHTVAHENSRLWQERAAVERGTESEQAYPDMTFSETWTADVGDETIRATFLGPAHTSGDAVIHFQQADVVHMGDLVFNRYPCFIDRDSGASIAGWISILEKVHHAHSDEAIFIFGHGNPRYGVTGSRSGLLVMRDFLTGLLEYAADAVSKGLTEDQLAETRRLPDFPEHYSEDWKNGVPNALRKAYQELTDS